MSYFSSFYKKNIKKIFKKYKFFILYGYKDYTKIKFCIFIYKYFKKLKLKIFVSKKNFFYSKKFLKNKKIKILKKNFVNNLNDYSFNVIYCLEDLDKYSCKLLCNLIEKNKKNYFIFISFDINKIKSIIIDKIPKVKFNTFYNNFNKISFERKNLIKNYNSNKISIKKIYFNICFYIKKNHKNYYYYFLNLNIFLNNKKLFIEKLNILMIFFFNVPI
ncbi:hypothetical protein [Candidatus Vidania fulgoroideorum]